MLNLNNVQLAGVLGQNPEYKKNSNDIEIARLSIATHERWVDKEGKKQESTSWHRLVMFGKQAKLAHDFLKKGSKVYIEGKLRTRDYEDEGAKKWITEVVVGSFQFLDPKETTKAK